MKILCVLVALYVLPTLEINHFTWYNQPNNVTVIIGMDAFFACTFNSLAPPLWKLSLHGDQYRYPSTLPPYHEYNGSGLIIQGVDISFNQSYYQCASYDTTYVLQKSTTGYLTVLDPPSFHNGPHIAHTTHLAAHQISSFVTSIQSTSVQSASVSSSVSLDHQGIGSIHTVFTASTHIINNSIHDMASNFNSQNTTFTNKTEAFPTTRHIVLGLVGCTTVILSAAIVMVIVIIICTKLKKHNTGTGNEHMYEDPSIITDTPATQPIYEEIESHSKEIPTNPNECYQRGGIRLLIKH